MTSAQSIVSAIPARLDRLRWSRFHTLVAVTLGATWVLDGLEVTLVGSLSGALSDRASLALSPTEIGLTASAYLVGAVLGALYFGWLTDRLGRKRLFFVTLGVYMVATMLSGVAWNFWSFALFRFFTGTGIGGEYSAINSAVQEFTPARYRGHTDLAINGSWWLGAAFGALGSVFVLDPHIFAADVGWRLAFIIGGALAACLLFLRRLLPESPRWLMTHGRIAQAEAIVTEIEQRAGDGAPAGLPTISLSPSFRLTLPGVARMLFVNHPRRVVLGLTLMATQAFFYNAIFFTYALILTKFYGVAQSDIGWFMLPFAAGNFLGPLLLGRLFDTVGRKPMIAGTYAIAGVLMAVVGYLFSIGILSAAEQTAAWTVIFFFASAGASAAYLTVGESFPLEARALTIALFYAFGTALGGVAGPAVFGALIESGSRERILWGYLFGGGLMIVAAIVEMLLGVKAEGRSLEDVARPMGAAD
ncbi:MAG TPA: MFS transporter [Rhizomicrobium sp.]